MSIARAATFGAVLLSATLVEAADIKPLIVFDTGGKFDKSFNEGVANGAERFKEETGVAPAEFEVANETQIEQGASPLCPARIRSHHCRRLQPGGCGGDGGEGVSGRAFHHYRCGR